MIYLRQQCHHAWVTPTTIRGETQNCKVLFVNLVPSPKDVIVQIFIPASKYVVQVEHKIYVHSVHPHFPP